jgi:hypothetical protein
MWSTARRELDGAMLEQESAADNYIIVWNHMVTDSARAARRYERLSGSPLKVLKRIAAKNVKAARR